MWIHWLVFFFFSFPLVRNNFKWDDLNKDWCVLAGFPAAEKHILRHWTAGSVSARSAFGMLNILEHVKSSLPSLGTLGIFYDKGFKPALAVWAHRHCFFKVFQESDWDKENSSVSLQLSKWMNLIMRVHRLIHFKSVHLFWCRFSGIFMKGGQTLWLGKKKKKRKSFGKMLYHIRREGNLLS